MSKEIEAKLDALLSLMNPEAPKGKDTSKKKRFNLIQISKLKQHLKDE